MNKTLKIFATAGVGCMLAACESFTDLEPKGMNILKTTAQLELLLNRTYTLSVVDMQTVCSDMVSSRSPLATYINRPQKSLDVIMWTYDESETRLRAELTNSDGFYNASYGIIGKVCNPILTRADGAEGSDECRAKIKSEALTLRAYYHWLLVNRFAKAYNPATAARTPGIPYSTEEWDIQTPIAQSTVEEVYDRILADCNKAIALDGLPIKPVNAMRMSKACPYAVKALALLSMQRWDEAEAAARQSLAIKGDICNYNEMLATIYGHVLGLPHEVFAPGLHGTSEDLFFAYDFIFSSHFQPSTWRRMEPGHVIREKACTDAALYDGTKTMADEISLGMDGCTTVYDSDNHYNVCGMKTSQMWLVIAEAETHKGGYKAAMRALDKIRGNRIALDVYQPWEGTACSSAEAMERVKQTSIGENVLSVHDFINYKRWNQVPGWEQTFTRTINGVTYTLRPDSPLWVFPFGRDIIERNPLVKQNY